MDDELTRYRNGKNQTDRTQKNITLNYILEYFEEDYKYARYTYGANTPHPPVTDDPFIDMLVAEKVYEQVGEDWHILSNRNKIAAFTTAYKTILDEFYPAQRVWDITFTPD